MNTTHNLIVERIDGTTRTYGLNKSTRDSIAEVLNNPNLTGITLRFGTRLVLINTAHAFTIELVTTEAGEE